MLATVRKDTSILMAISMQFLHMNVFTINLTVLVSNVDLRAIWAYARSDLLKLMGEKRDRRSKKVHWLITITIYPKKICENLSTHVHFIIHTEAPDHEKCGSFKAFF